MAKSLCTHTYLPFFYVSGNYTFNRSYEYVCLVYVFVYIHRNISSKFISYYLTDIITVKVRNNLPPFLKYVCLEPWKLNLRDKKIC